MPFSLKSFFIILTLLFFLISPFPTQSAFFFSPQVELKLADVSISAIKPTFSWYTESDNPIESHFFYLDIDKSKIFTDDAALQKNVGTNFSYQLTDSEQLNENQTYYWGIKAVDSEGQEGYSDIDLFDPLILKFEPVLYFHPEEDFYPADVESFVLYSSLWDSKGNETDVQLGYEYDLTLDDLTPEEVDTSGWYLQFVEDLIDKTPDPVLAKQEYQSMRDNDFAPFTYYGYKTEDSFVDDDGKTHSFIVLEYWYFYVFNDFGAKVPGGNNHEGDWECVMVFLDKESLTPLYVAYSAHHNKGQQQVPILHFDSVRREWNSEEVTKENGNIISFVGLGSHGSYPNNGDNGIHSIPFYGDDRTSASGTHFINSDWTQKLLLLKDELPNWVVNYKGLWGVVYPKSDAHITSGPNGPYYSEYDKFLHPVQWAGIDKISKKTIMEAGINTINLAKSKTTIVFNKTLEIGTEIAVDLHTELVSFGQNVKNLILAPRFWDISSNLLNNTFQAEVSLNYDSQEIADFGIDDPSKLTIFVYNDTGQIWEKVPTVVDAQNQAVKFNTTHFSIYAIGIDAIEPEEPTFQDIADKIKVVIESRKGRYNKRKQEKEISVLLANKSDLTISGDLRLVVNSINQDGVELLNPDGKTDDNKPYIDFTTAYDNCRFIGTEQDIPKETAYSIKRRLLKAVIEPKKRCDKILKKYPELKPFIQENILAPNLTTQSKALKFRVPSRDVRYFDIEWRVENR